MKKILTIFMALLTSLILFGCDNKDNKEDSANSNVSALKVSSKVWDLSSYKYESAKAAKISSITGDVYYCKGNLLFTREVINSVNKIHVYNLDTQTLITTHNLDDMHFLSETQTATRNYAIYFVEEENAYGMYNCLGDKINELPLSATLSVSSIMGNIFFLDGDFYVIGDEGVITLSPSSYGSNDYDYYFNNCKYSLDECAVIQKDDQEPVFFAPPEGTYSSSSFILANGDVAIQYSYIVTENDDYTYYESTSSIDQYFKMVTVQLSPDGSTKEIDFNYLIEEIYNEISFEESMNYIKSDIDNIFYAYPINNKRCSEDDICATLSNSLEVGEMIITPYTRIEVVNETRSIVSLGDMDYVYDQNGTYIGEFGGSSNWTSKYFIKGNAIYNWDLEKLESTVGYTYYGKIGNCFVFIKSDDDYGDKVYIYNDGFKKIADYYLDIEVPFFGYVSIYNGSLYTLYNEDGTVLISSGSNITNHIYYYGNDFVILLSKNNLNNSNEYYKIEYSVPYNGYFS